MVKKRLKLASLILACVSVIISFLLAEIMIMVFTPFGTGPLNPIISNIKTTFRAGVLKQQQIATFDPVDGVFIGRRMVPNSSVNTDIYEFSETHSINSKGYHDYEDTEVTADHCFTTAVLGDSFTFGTGSSLDETYPSLLEKHFGVRFYNMGVGSHSNVEAYLHILKNDPGVNMIILGLWLPKMVLRDQQFLGEYFEQVKDRFDNPKSLREALAAGNAEVNNLPLVPRAKSFLKRNSSLYLFASSNRNVFGAVTKLFLKSEVIEQEFSLRMQDHPYPVERMSPDYIYPEGFQSAQQDYFSVTFEILEQLKRYSGSKDVNLVILLIPSKAQVYWPVFIRINPNLDAQFSPDVPNQIISKFLDEQEIHYLDLLPLLRKQVDLGMVVWDNEKELYFGIDSHWTKNAHALTAHYVAEFLLRQDLISLCRS